MPSIYTNLRKSDRKYIASQKALIRRQFLDAAKQQEMISELYKKMVGKAAVVPGEAAPKAEKTAVKETSTAKKAVAKSKKTKAKAK